MSKDSSKRFHRLALKQKVELLQKTRGLSVLTSELEKAATLKEQLDEVLQSTLVQPGQQTAASLRAGSWYREKVMEQRQTIDSRRQFLAEEVAEEKGRLAKIRRRYDKSLETAKQHEQVEKNARETRQEADMPKKNPKNAL